MRTLLVIVSFVTMFLRLSSAEQLIPVTPQSLDTWTVAGADKSALVQRDRISLPAGAQLSRTFSGSAVILHLVSRPVFSGTPADWPILEIGPVALAFTRYDAQGKLVLVIGEETQIALPWSVPSDGAAVDLILGYDQVSGTGLVGFGSQSQFFDATGTALNMEVLLTAGAKSRWPQDLMNVLLLTGDAEAGQSATAGSEADRDIQKAKLKAAMEKLRDQDSRATAPNPGMVGVAKPADPASAKVSGLEIFTPPAVRHGRAEAVRGTLVSGQSK